MKINIVIPSLEPTYKLIEICKSLLLHGFNNIIVVNDGSGRKYKHIFKEIEELGIIVLNHSYNKGKGAALKTAFKYMCDNSFYPCITMDSDGQHTINDVINIRKCLIDNPNSLILGCRDFSSDNVPFKNMHGNIFTRMFFKLRFKRFITDTQSGLRGIPSSFYKELILLKEDRFDFELKMLAVWKDRDIKEITIDTVYEKDSNKSSHFNTIPDSYKIYKIFFSK